MPSDLDVTQALPYLKPVAPSGTAALKVSREDSPVMRPFIGRLLISYLVDQGDWFEYVQHRHLDAVGFTEDQLHRHALHNLALRAAAGEVRTASQGSITAVFFDGNLESSLMLLDPLWPHIADRLGGDVLAAAPARDILAVCPAHSTNGRQELNAMIEKLWPVGDHLLTRDLYLRRNDAWQVATPADSI